jgi:ABC-type phosphate transport system auxiliary subunit
LILHSQSYSQKDSICFGYEDARHILKLANKGQQFDSIVFRYESIILDQIEQLSIKGDELQLSGELIMEQLAQINKLQSDLDKSERKRSLLKRIAIGLGLVVVTETFILFIQ